MIDTHSHLFVEEFDEDLPAVIERARDSGVSKVFMPNIDDTTVEAMLNVCTAYKGYCFPMIGFHPTSVGADSLFRIYEMKKLLSGEHPFVAVGEVGMDLYWDKTYLKEQQKALDIQIQWALEYHLPLVLHCREAFPELFEVMEPYKKTELSGIFHSFTGTLEEAGQVLEYARFFFGINGIAFLCDWCKDYIFVFRWRSGQCTDNADAYYFIWYAAWTDFRCFVCGFTFATNYYVSWCNTDL